MSLIESLIDEALITISGSVGPRTVFISIRNDGVSGSGTEEDPYNGATDALLDPILSNMPVNSEIRFRPGVFRTKGFGAGTFGFQPNSGQRFIGSGMHQTILHLVKAAKTDDADIIVVGVFSQGGTVDSIEIRDKTIDVNLSRQPLTSDGISKRRIKAQAINLLAATNIRMRRVRVINWGTYTQTNEDFPIFIGFDHRRNADRAHREFDALNKVVCQHL